MTDEPSPNPPTEFDITTSHCIPRLAAMTDAQRAEHGLQEREHAEGVALALGLNPTFDVAAYAAMLDEAG